MVRTAYSAFNGNRVLPGPERETQKPLATTEKPFG